MLLTIGIILTLMGEFSSYFYSEYLNYFLKNQVMMSKKMLMKRTKMTTMMLTP
jgi:hypothetical protein